MTKLLKKDSKKEQRGSKGWKLFCIVLVVLVLAGFLVISFYNEYSYKKLATYLNKTMKNFEIIVENLSTTVSSDVVMLKENIYKCTKNINFLIHRVKILEEKVAKLEAQIELLKCEKKLSE